VSQVDLQQLNSGDRAYFVAALGSLFEHSPWVAEETYDRRPFRDAAHLYSELCATMRRANAERQMALINAHPDLAGRLAQEGRLTAESTQEQASAALNRLTPEQLQEFQRLNQAYRAAFGFPFIICARLNDRSAILRALQERLPHGPEEEQGAALVEIEKIAWLRLQDKLT